MGLGKIGVVLAVLCWGFGASGETPSKPQAAKVLRYAFEIAETGFDPAQISDYYSRTATENMFDALYRYDYPGAARQGDSQCSGFRHASHH